jgi:hypothetical protein
MNTRLLRQLQLKLTQGQQQVLRDPCFIIQLNFRCIILLRFMFPPTGVARRVVAQANFGGQAEVQGRHGAGREDRE